MNRPEVIEFSATAPVRSNDPSFGIIRPGANCWRLALAPRSSVLIDAAEYFAALNSALRKAKRSITIIGWDFDGRIRLMPETDSKETLGELLRALVENTPLLEVRILVWSVAVVHAPGATLPLLFGTDWEKHPRIKVRLDTQHPIYAAHHQKLVTIDDELAFVGGIDLTVRRWDSCDHKSENPLRINYDGASYGPVHDLQMVVDGPAARALAQIGRKRWKVATDETLAPHPTGQDIWPSGLAAEFQNQKLAIARTAPPWRGDKAIREAATLTRDAILAARKIIYIEAQYLTARYIRNALKESLAKADGPEILVILTRSSEGFVERFIMGVNSDRLIRNVRRADHEDRFRVYYPVADPENGGKCRILVHSKLVMVDDIFLRVGSSNFNNRSVGLDTECDVALEAQDAETRRGIAQLRHRLIGEHIHAPAEDVARLEAQTGSMLKTVEALNGARGGLVLFPAIHETGPIRSVFGTRLLDPARPFEPLWFLKRRRRRRMLPRRRRTHGISS